MSRVIREAASLDWGNHMEANTYFPNENPRGLVSEDGQPLGFSRNIDGEGARQLYGGEGGRCVLQAGEHWRKL